MKGDSIPNPKNKPRDLSITKKELKTLFREWEKEVRQRKACEVLNTDLLSTKKVAKLRANYFMYLAEKLGYLV